MKLYAKPFQRRRFTPMAMLLIALGVTGCASKPEAPSSAERAMEEARAEAARPQQMPPESVTDQLLKGDLQAGDNQPLEERFNISVSQVPARTFFLGLVGGTNTNLVVHPEVEGVISLELNDVTLEEVLGITRDVFGYEFRKSSGIYTILPRSLRTEVFSIDYLDVEREGFSDTGVKVGASTDDDNDRNNNSSDSNRSNSRPQEMGTGSRVKTRSESKFWESLRISVETIVQADRDDGQERMVMVNSQTGMVVVRALPKELAAVREFLQKSQLSAGRQVILETKIIEVKLDDGFEAGIDWSAMQGSMGASYEWFDGDLTSSANQSINSGEFGAIFGVSNINDFIQFLETQGRVQVLSSPRVSTVNNQKAIIRVGSDEFFVTGISNSTTASAATTTNTPTVELSSFFSGIALDVTPQIAENGDVILHVHPVISEVSDQIKQLTVGDDDFSLPLALRDIRESDSIVRARDGQVIVLGGLMQEINSESTAEKPWLGKIPGLNILFKRRQDGLQKTELVILMRPVVATDEAWDDDMQRTEQRMRDLGVEYRDKF